MKTGIYRRSLHFLYRNWTILALFVAWQAWVALRGYNEIVAPTPGAVIGEIFMNPTVYAIALIWTACVALTGLVSGVTLGAFFALAAYFSPLASGMVTPLTLLLRCTPVPVMIPVLIQVLGTGQTTVLAIATIVSFFPSFVLIGAGLRSPSRSSRDLFSALGASRVSTIRYLLFPIAASYGLISLRITAPTAVLGTMLAEYLLSEHGLGYLFSDSIIFSNTARAWGAGVLAMGLAVVAFSATSLAERWGSARMN
ncbi:ABC transporter permease [Streptomyces virginiae]|uniref:ABC transporter permease n=1 Tax=Streptomyces virginiae TaxID=1961 RepID=UPI000B14B2C3|nr:ABC transporter permease subunit [Streptomyces virginiae]